MIEQKPKDDKATPVSLEALNQRLKAIVEAKTEGKPVLVRGRATDVSRTQSKHVHLRLRQDKYGLGCVVFRSLARTLPFWIENGQTLLVQGEMQVDPVWGELQLVAHHVELETPKHDQDRFRTLKARARAAGWLDRSRKRPLPRPPQVVGLITGEQSQARADVIGSLKDAGIQPQIAFEPASMQGPEIVEQVKSALATMNDNPDVDVIVIARGGGSKTELATFNDGALAQAIVESRVPVVTAIGHRQNKSLADYVADRAVPTPSSVGPILARRPALAGRLSPAERSEMRQKAVVIAVLVLLAVFLYLCGQVNGWW